MLTERSSAAAQIAAVELQHIEGRVRMPVLGAAAGAVTRRSI
jgi:hypothetical protein